jgi:hypothetical protein
MNEKEMAQSVAVAGRRRVPLFITAVALALGLNVFAWIAAYLRPNDHGTWTIVSLLCFYVLGLVIGQWWALLATCAYAVIHAIPVYLGLLPGYLSTWGEALWWVFALAILLAITGLGVVTRLAIRRVRARRTI